MSSNKKIYIVLIIISVFASISISLFIVNKRFIRTDQLQHFYDMRKWYDSKTFPVTSARFTNSEIIKDEFTTGRVPGGAYYVFYILFYKLSNENFIVSKVINLIFNLIIAYIFLFWIFKKFGYFFTSIISMLLLFNPYFIMASTDFWNPNLSLIFSLLLFIFLFEYIDDCDEDDKRKNIVRISAVLIFPILAIIAQGHFFSFFSIIPTIIVYLIIKYKRTLKYIVYWILGVFISFLEYLPYLISEFNNGFNNTKLIFETKSGFSSFPFPQIHAIFLLPTNEMSIYYSSNLNGILHFWKSNPFAIIGIIFLFISVLFSIYCFIRSGYFLFFNRKKTYIDNNSINKRKIILNMLFIMYLYIPITIILNIVFTSKVGAFHYFFPMFSISFLPILLFFYDKENDIINNRKIFIIVLSLFFINIFSMSLQFKFYTDMYEEPLSYNNIKNIIEIVYKDSDGSKINFRALNGERSGTYIDASKIYFPDMSWDYDENSTNIYLLLDKIKILYNSDDYISNYMKKFNNTNFNLIFTNSGINIYKYYGNLEDL
ncbi:hypothetical protein [Brachyspira pilosicoli]|uniref:hypothetical protein n=1 Tax=Brachyspira pilosicoli TaxID=52584 RepID=UPI0012F4E2DF|nr:hypothetical protein [Brachyspira pilosicoli]